MTRKNRNLLDEVWFKWKGKCNMSNLKKKLLLMSFASRLGFEVFCAKTQSSFHLEVYMIEV